MYRERMPRRVEPSPIETPSTERRRVCPVCGGELVDIKQKLVCARCRAICETCCEGGRG